MKLIVVSVAVSLLLMPSAISAEPAAIKNSTLIENARKLIKENQLLDAKKTYEELLQKQNFTKSQLRTIESDLEKVNMKILFSPLQSEGSFIYQVKSGDNLYDLAKKHRTTIALIKKSNQLKNDMIKIGSKLKIQKSIFSLRIDKSDNILQLFADDEPVKRYRVATGENNKTPAGEFKVVNKIENPTWYHAGAVVPPGSPDNILGTHWLGFDLKGYGIHGTTLPETIGTQASAGCVRMLNSDVAELYDLLPLGTKVIVAD